MKTTLYLLLLLCLPGLVMAQPTVSSLSPTRNARSVPRNTNVTVTLSQAPSSATALTVWSQQAGGKKAGTASISGNSLVFNPTADFKPGEVVYATITRASGLAKAQVYQFITAAAVAPASFPGNTSVAVGTNPQSVAVGDVDGDSDLDFLTANLNSASVSVRLNDGLGNFSGSTSVAVGISPISVAVGDVDGDGDLDLLAANFSSASVSVRLNDGLGNFSGSTNVAVGTGPQSVALGDVDGDGDLDLLTAANSNSGSVSVRLNDGTGNFSGSTSVSVGTQPVSVVLGDVDGDGDLDFLTANYSSGSVSVRLNDGTGSFSGSTSVAVGSNPSSVAVGDVDEDGDLDLLAANFSSNSVSVRLNNGTGTFTGSTSVAVGSNPASVALGDVDGDGDLDLLGASAGSASVSVRLNDGTGNFSGSTDVAVGNGPYSVAVGDVDGDGDLDLLTANYSGNSVSVRLNDPPTITSLSPVRNTRSAPRNTNVTVTLNQAPSSATALTVWSQQAGGKKAGTASISGNSLVFNPTTDFKPGEVVYATTTQASGLAKAQVYQFTTAAAPAPASFIGSTSVAVGTNPRSIAVGDVDGDGDLDLLTANVNSGSVSIRLNNGTGSYSGSTNVSLGTNPRSVAVGDVDGDGDLDFLTADYLINRVSVRLNDGTGTFSGSTSVAVGSVPVSVAVGDVDGDGDLDLLTTNNNSDNVSVRLNDGTGTFSGSTSVAVGRAPARVVMGDVDGDGDLDLLTANLGGASVSVRLNDGSGNFSGSTDVAVGSGPISIALGDVDGDGDLDFLTANNFSTTVSVRFNDGAGSFSSGTSIVVGSDLQSVELSDVDGDGDLDLLTANRGSNNVSVQLNDGSGNFSGSTDVAVGSGPYDVAVGDVDGDGDLDLLVANYTSNSVSVRLNSLAPTIGSSPASATVCAGVTTSFRVTATNATAYRWQLNTGQGFADLNDGGVYSGATTSTLTLTGVPASFNGYQYRVVVSGGGSVTSTAATLTVDSPQRLYVKANASGANTGLSWADAFTDLQSALTYPCSQSLTEIWVATGTYKPTSTTARNASFAMLPDVAIYGGFMGTETNLSQRPSVNPVTGNPSSSTLSGNIGTAGTTSDNSYNVVRNDGFRITSTARLDGFVITGGNANGSAPANVGGGIYNTNGSSPMIVNCVLQSNQATSGGAIYNQTSCSPTITNCVLQSNSATSGGAIYNQTFSNPTITNCVLQSNTVAFSGGAIYNLTSSPVLTNCSLLSNSAIDGGAITNAGSSSPVLTNCVLQGNLAISSGGAMFNQGNGRPALTNCVLQGNSAFSGATIYNSGSNPVLTNCSLQGNSGGVFQNLSGSSPVLTNCVVFGNGSSPGSGTTARYSLFDAATFISDPTNLSTATSPFVSTTSAELNSCAPAIGAADPTTTTATVGTTDLAGNARFTNGRLDMGAYQYQGVISSRVGAITTQPVVGTAVFVGTSVSVPVSATGTGTLTYQWYKDGAVVSGQTSATLSLAQVSLANAGSYSVVVSSACNSLTSTAFSLTVNAQPTPTRLYVKANASGANTGLSWTDAFTDLQSALTYPNSQSLTEIWVATGTYKPTTTTGPSSRTISFVMLPNVAIYGGFAGTEQNLSERPAVNPVTGNPSSSTLSGDIGTADDNSDNTQIIVRNTGNLTSTARLDGFVITRGYGTGGLGGGAGIYNSSSSPTITNCVLQSNTASSGGAIANFSNSNPTITNCVLQSNSAGSGGGAIANGSSNPTITNCVLQSNTAGNGGALYNVSGSNPVLTDCVLQNNSAFVGGVLYNISSSPVLTNCSLLSNVATAYGGANYNESGSAPRLTSCVLQSNSASTGGAIYNTGSVPSLTNCVLRWNRASGTGGAIHNQLSSDAVLTNCVLQSNTASSGGGIFNTATSAPVLTNCSFQENLANSGGALHNTSSSNPTIVNCVFYGFLTNTIINVNSTPTARYSLFNGPSFISGPGNLTTATSPFVSTTSAELNSCALAIGAADPTTTSATVGTADLAGNPRFTNGRLDMGAYQFQGVIGSRVGAITAQPVAGTAVFAGTPVSVPMSATGTGTLTYQWYKGGAAVSGQTSATLSLSTTTTADAGSYSVVVSSACNSLTSTAFSLTVNALPTRLYVKADASGANTGLSWADAFTSLQSALTFPSSQSLTEIWVATGTYKPTSTTDRGYSFRMLSNVALYGGFVGDETALSQRPVINPTIGSPSSSTLSGDLQGNDGPNFQNTSDNSYNVINNAALTGAAILDGFVITGGNANFIQPYNRGGGIYNAGVGLTVVNCSFINNQASRFGGAIYNEGNGFTNTLVLTNCSFQSNRAPAAGAILNVNSNPILTNCSFQSNSATNGGGGAIYFSVGNITGTPVLTNCSFQGNTATQSGAALYNYQIDLRLVNSVLWNNGGSNAIFTETNATLTARYNLFDAASFVSGPGNLTTATSPFVSAISTELNNCALAIGAADPATTSATVGTTDLAGNPRFTNGRLDMGAYQYQGVIGSRVGAITAQPVAGTAVCVGTSVSVPMSATGTGTLTYQWYKDGAVVSGQTSATLSLPATTTADAGSYSVVVSSSCNSLTSTAFSMTVNAQPTPTLTANASGSITCATTSLTLTATGGTSYTFAGPGVVSANPVAGTAVVNAAGTYTVTAGVAGGCTGSATLTIGQNTTPPVVSVGSAVTLLNCITTVITLTANGGGTYRWDDANGSTTRTLNVATARTYSVTVTGANGCTAVGQRTIGSDYTQPSLSLTATDVCVGQSVTLTASPGLVSYTYYVPSGQIGGGLTSTTVLTGLTAGTYSFSVTARHPTSFCQATATAGATVSALPVATLSASPSTTLTCAQTSLTLTATGGASYTFTGPSGGIASQNQAGGTAVISVAGTYTVTVGSVSGCSSTTTLTIDSDTAPPANPQLTASNSGTLTCAVPSLTLTASATGTGLTYSFSGPSGVVAGNGNTRVVSAPGTYTVVITGANGCTATATTDVSSNTTAPTVSVSPTSATLTCSTTSVTLTASGSAATYRWTGGATSNTLVVSSPGTYAVTATSGNGCTAVSNNVVVSLDNTAPSTPTLSASPSTTLTCAQTSLTLTASATGTGLTYVFSGPSGVVGGSGNTRVVNAPGAYSVVITGANGCTSTNTITIEQNGTLPTPTLTVSNGAGVASNTLTCAQTSLTLTAGGGSSYAFAGPGVVSQNALAGTAVVNASGTYSVTVTNTATGCFSTTTTDITSNTTAPTVSVSPTSATLTCAVTSVTLTASGSAGSYRWTGGSSASTLVVSSPGTYAVTATSANGCTAVSNNVVVNQDIVAPASPQLTASNSGTLTCAVPSLTLAASATGTGLTYSFNGPSGVIVGSGNTRVVSAPGTYTVVITGANGCTATATTTVSSNTAVPTGVSLTPSPSSTLTCAQTSLTLTASATGTGLSYAFSGPLGTLAGSGNTRVISTPGAYTVLVTTSSGCTAIATSTISQDIATPTASLSVASTTFCANSSLTLVAGGGQSYRFGAGATQLGGSSSNTATVSAAGMYSVTVTADNGCTATASVSVSTVAVTTLTSVPPTSASVCEGQPVSFSVGASGTNLTYQWYKNINANELPGQTSPTLRIASATLADAGNYFVVVTGSCGQVSSVGTLLTVRARPAAPTLTTSSVTAVVSTTPLPLTPFVVATGNTLSFSGVNGLLNPPVADVSTAGVQNFSVAATDAFGCVSLSTPFSLTVYPSQSEPPASQTVCRGNNVVFSVSATATRYQWYRVNGTALLRLTDVAGVQRGTGTASLTLLSVQTSASYVCQATLANGSVVSYGPYAIGVTICGGREAAAEPTLSLSVVVAPNPLVGQWLRAVVRGAGGEPLQVDLYDQQGRRWRQAVIERAANEQPIEWPVDDVPVGTLLLRASTDRQSQTIKIIHD